MKKLEETEKTCTKDVDQVSHTWEALMDDKQSQRIASEITMFETNIMLIRNEMKQLTLAQRMANAIEMWKLQ